MLSTLLPHLQTCSSSGHLARAPTAGLAVMPELEQGWLEGGVSVSPAPKLRKEAWEPERESPSSWSLNLRPVTSFSFPFPFLSRPRGAFHSRKEIVLRVIATGMVLVISPHTPGPSGAWQPWRLTRVQPRLPLQPCRSDGRSESSPRPDCSSSSASASHPVLQVRGIWGGTHMSPEASASKDSPKMASRAPQHGLLCYELSALGWGGPRSLRVHPKGRSSLYCGFFFVFVFARKQ